MTQISIQKGHLTDLKDLNKEEENFTDINNISNEEKKIESNLKAYPYLLIFVGPLLAIWGFYMGGWYNYSTLFFSYVLLPILELICGVDGYNPTKEESKYLESKLSFRFVTWSWIPMQIFLTIYLSASVSIYWNYLSWFEIIGFVFAIGLNTGGTGITVAHELIHKQNNFEQILGKITLMCVCYMHFFIEHLQGHHKRIATEEDPATSRFGESFYRFLPRTLIGGFNSAWDIESRRLIKQNKSFWSIYNQMLWFIILPLLYGVLLGLIFGLPAFFVFFVQSLIAISLLEVVNYIEHYGLQRKKIGSKNYESVNVLHSWNADFKMTNYFLFKLQRHADHHTWPTRRYQTLRSWDFSPQFPTGYAGMTLIAFIPPLFWYIMNPKVKQFNLLSVQFDEDSGLPAKFILK